MYEMYKCMEIYTQFPRFQGKSIRIIFDVIEYKGKV